MDRTQTAELIGTLSAAISKLTIFRSRLLAGPLGRLSELLHFVGASDKRNAMCAFSDLTAELVCGGARRVSGNIWLDYILDTVLLTDNAFSTAAASGSADEAVLHAMQRELSALQTLSEVGENDLFRMIRDCPDATGKTPREAGSMKDSASVIASAAWGGAPVAAMPREVKPKQPPAQKPELTAPVWQYGEFGIRDSYYADVALEGMYRRFIEAEDWAELVNDLWNFHAAYGSGIFLKYRNFIFDGTLKPLHELRAGDFVPVMDAEYRLLLNNAIAFMRDESAHPMLLCGQQGMGKTTMMLELTDELPQLRLVYALGSNLNCTDLLSALRCQPLKFMLLFDELNADTRGIVSEPLLPMNVLLAACSKAPMLSSLFEVIVELPVLQLNEFVRIVTALLAAENVNAAPETIRSACVDYQVDTRCEFNIAAAVRVKELLLS